MYRKVVHAHHPDMLYIHVRGGQWAARPKGAFDDIRYTGASRPFHTASACQARLIRHPWPVDPLRDLQQRALHHRSFGSGLDLLFPRALAAGPPRLRRRRLPDPRGLAVLDTAAAVPCASASHPWALLRDRRRGFRAGGDLHQHAAQRASNEDSHCHASVAMVIDDRRGVLLHTTPKLPAASALDDPQLRHHADFLDRSRHRRDSRTLAARH